MKEQKTAFVTGASSGIGYSVAIELAKRGYKVFAGARRLEVMKPLEDFGVNILELDVSSLSSIQKAKQIISQETNGSLDILYNNAGISCGGAAFDLEEKMIQRAFEVNVFGPMNMVKEFHPLLIKLKGLIAFTGSTAALVPMPFLSVYSSTKGALQSYTNSLAVEVEPFGIKVLNLVAGAVETEIGDEHPSPSDSVYIIDGDDIYGNNAGTFSKRKKMSSKVFAQKAVNDFEKAVHSTGGNYWLCYRGKMATMVWFLTTFVPRSMFSPFVVSSLGLKDGFDKLRSRYNST